MEEDFCRDIRQLFKTGKIEKKKGTATEIALQRELDKYKAKYDKSKQGYKTAMKVVIKTEKIKKEKEAQEAKNKPAYVPPTD